MHDVVFDLGCAAEVGVEDLADRGGAVGEGEVIDAVALGDEVLD